MPAYMLIWLDKTGFILKEGNLFSSRFCLESWGGKDNIWFKTELLGNLSKFFMKFKDV